ncbi:VOC family protein [Mangrovivirga sp. M17]|uniref:VOC family protein n=1 Tax=Mangrovivirga halotolerans TaxID=2993936 RepID=A0ABT3RUE0_9BACT|nr:VOC family protein [Mangrovivirga halotolerans]MCX2745397.1 VOC family protein [Mangrovivirga halotolerans]
MKSYQVKSLTLIIAFILTSFMINIQAQNGASTDDSPKLSLQHVTIVVTNFEESKYFYTKVLMLKPIKADWLPEKQMFISLGDNLELHMGEVEGVEVNPNSFNHFALAVPNFDEFLKDLKDRGYTYGSLGKGNDDFISERPDKVRQTWIKDPDGYWVEINDMYK